MKQIHLSWLLMAAAVITACEKERVITESPVEKTSYVYSVKATISSETRTDYDASGKFSWTAGDQISVLFNDGKANRFFTLTTEAGGETATFTGTIETGYTIGATDGTDDDAKIWALYPASENHAYTEGANPTFYVQPEVDFTETGFSANIPMYDQLTAEDAFSFKNLASTYKFTVKDLDSSIKKVKLTVTNQTTYGLSGSWPIHAGEIYLNYGYADPGEKRMLTYTNSVSDGKAVFYVSCRYWGDFQPAITIYDAEQNVVLNEFTANTAKQPTSFTKIQQISLSAIAGPKEAIINAEDVTVKVGKTKAIGATTNSSAAIEYVSGNTSIATVTSDGTVEGVAVGSTTITLSVPAVEGKFTEASKTINVTVTEASTSVIDIDGDMSDWETISAVYNNNSNSRIREIKFASDSEYLYFYFKMRKNRSYDKDLYIGFDWDDTGAYSGGNLNGCELLIKGHPFSNASAAQPVCVNGFDPNGKINGTSDASALYAMDYDDGSDLSSDSSNHYLEISILRSKLPNLPDAGTTINLAASFDYYVTDFNAITLK